METQGLPKEPTGVTQGRPGQSDRASQGEPGIFWLARVAGPQQSLSNFGIDNPDQPLFAAVMLYDMFHILV